MYRVNACPQTVLMPATFPVLQPYHIYLAPAKSKAPGSGSGSGSQEGQQGQPQQGQEEQAAAADEEPLVFAGLYDVWDGPEGPMHTYTILTTGEWLLGQCSGLNTAGGSWHTGIASLSGCSVPAFGAGSVLCSNVCLCPHCGCYFALKLGLSSSEASTRFAPPIALQVCRRQQAAGVAARPHACHPAHQGGAAGLAEYRGQGRHRVSGIV